MENNSISKNFLWKFAERFTAQVVSFVVSLVLARLLLPDDYGVVALVLVFIEIANVFVSTGLGVTLIQKKDADDLDFSSVLYFNFGLSVFLYIILFFTAPVVAQFYEMELLIPVIRVFSIRIIFASINSVQQAYVARKMIFKKFFWATFIGTAISGGVGIYLAYKGFGVWALVVQYLVNTTIDTIVLGIVIRWKPRLAYSWKRIRDLIKFGWKILVEGLANTISGQIRNLIIGKVYSESDLGYYTKAKQFPQLIMNNINASISAVMLPALSNVQDNEERMVHLTRKSVKVSSYILFPMMFGLAAVATNLVTVLLGEKWINCVPYLYIYCFTYLISIGLYSRHEALKAKGRSDVFMIEHIFSRIINLIVLILVFRISVMAIALSGVGGSLLLAVIIMFTSKKYTGYKYKDQILDVAGLVLMSFLMFVPTFLFGYLANLNPIIELVIQVIIGCCIYVFLSIVFKPEGYIFVKDFGRKLLKRKNKNEVI